MIKYINYFQGTENRDSGVADVEVCTCPQNMALRSPEQVTAEDSMNDSQFKRSAFSNSLLDIHEQCKLLDVDLISKYVVNVVSGEKAQRRGSVGSLDSGMSVSFHTTLTSNDKVNYGSKLKNSTYQQQSFLSGLFNKCEQNSNRQNENGQFMKSTDV